MGMFLNKDELIELTGHRRCDAQRNELIRMKIKFEIRSDGSLAVLTAHIHKQFGGDAVIAKGRYEHNWGGINA